MRKLSTGQDSTLGSWIQLSTLMFGEDSKATLFLKEKVDNKGKGLDEEVIAEETQLLNVLIELNKRGNQ